MNYLTKRISKLNFSESVLNIRKYSQVVVTEENTFKSVVLSNPKTRNALSFSMLKELKDAVLHNDSHIRCVILKAEGKVFSSGHNLKELVGDSKECHRKIFKSCSELMLGMSLLPIPVIAQVNGIAAAAGCQLVASCDIVVASEKSTFSTPGANFGIFCSTPGIPLVRNVPIKRAADMLMTGLPITAHEALTAGLVSVVVSEDQLESETQKRIDAICHKSRSVIAIGKKFMYEQMEMNIDEAYRFGENVMIDNICMEDGQEGIESFIEKRKPCWSHKEK